MSFLWKKPKQKLAIRIPPCPWLLRHSHCRPRHITRNPKCECKLARVRRPPTNWGLTLIFFLGDPNHNVDHIFIKDQFPLSYRCLDLPISISLAADRQPSPTRTCAVAPPAQCPPGQARCTGPVMSIGDGPPKHSDVIRRGSRELWVRPLIFYNYN